MRPDTLLLQLALLVCTASHAASPPDGLPDDLDALSLADKAPTTAPQTWLAPPMTAMNRYSMP